MIKSPLFHAPAGDLLPGRHPATAAFGARAVTTGTGPTNATSGSRVAVTPSGAARPNNAGTNSAVAGFGLKFHGVVTRATAPVTGGANKGGGTTGFATWRRHFRPFNLCLQAQL